MRGKPKPGDIFAVLAGDFMGEFFVFIEGSKEYTFLSLPDFHIRKVPKNKYLLGIKDSILEFQETLPSDIFNDCIIKYNQIKS
tara:strand:+ start:205 stop:453 length:249 start_codon:yes stop_codon:yes gene_type:complete